METICNAVMTLSDVSNDTRKVCDENGGGTATSPLIIISVCITNASGLAM